jgi:putative addiction module killer protein
MLEFKTTDEFEEWLGRLKDRQGRARIFSRIDSVRRGKLGDCAPVGEGVSEMRIHYGPGYRLYFTRIGETVYLLLLGGDKSSQSKDIRNAIGLAREIRKEK